MLRSSGAMGVATLTSRILGLAREQAYAVFMGTGAVADAFTMAFTIPNLFRRLLGEGALTAAFIPIFKEKERREGEAAMWRSANAVISGLLVAASLVIGVVLLGLTLVLSEVPLTPNAHLMLQLLRLMFPYMLLVCLAAAFMGMLNARGHFFIPSLGAAMLNVVMIASVLLLAPRMGPTLEVQIFGLAIGVLVAGVAQAAFQVPTLLREGFRFRWERPWPNETVRQVVRKMLPASIGVAAFQINVLLIQVLAYGTGESIVASFNVAVRLMEFPQGIVGISLATYLLPTLSGFAADRDYGGFRSSLRQGLGYLLFGNLFAAALLLCLGEPIVRLLFEYGRFDEVSTAKVAVAVACLAPGLVAFSAVNILARAFYALGDTRTPMWISVFCLVTNLVISAMLVGRFSAGGLAAANSVTSFLNLGLLGYALRRKLGRLELAPLRSVGARLVLAAALAGAVALTGGWWWSGHVGHATVAHRLGEVFLPLAAAVAVYFLVAYGTGVPQAKDLLGLLRRRRTPTPP